MVIEDNYLLKCDKIRIYKGELSMVKLTEEEFKDMILNYYKEKGLGNIDCLFMKFDLSYKILDVHHRYIDGNDGWKVKERPEIVKRKQSLFIPFVANKEFCESKKTDVWYDPFEKLNITIDDIDLGTTDNFNFELLNNTIISSFPKECLIVYEDILNDIANKNGYTTFDINIYDKSEDKPPIAYCWPQWIYDITAYEEKDLTKFSR